MERITDSNKKDFSYMELAVKEAKKSSCNQAHCGSVIVKDGIIIGKGYNSPPGDKESQRRCNFQKKDFNEKITDKTCCIHAEQRAIMDALSSNKNKIKGSVLYFVRIDESAKKINASKPYCSICSKMALDVGISKFVLWNDGLDFYETEEYNNLTYSYS